MKMLGLKYTRIELLKNRLSGFVENTQNIEIQKNKKIKSK